VKASILWPCIIVGILSANVSIVGLTIAVSRAGGGYVVEKGYDQKALKWDEHKARIAKQAQLGWTLACDIAHATSGSGSIRVHMTDRTGAPLANARVNVKCFQAGWPKEVQTTSTTVTDADGIALVAFAPTREGTWVIDVAATSASDTFESRIERDVWFDLPAANAVNPAALASPAPLATKD
jgi:nitrogen fixation protein FixH